MALPKIEHPTFDIELPTTGQKVKFRPFLVKEEKILLMAMQSEDPQEIINSIKQVVNNCIITDNLDVNDIATLDLEYIFIKLRSRSVNNVIKLTYRDQEDNKKYDVEVNLDEVTIKRDEEHSNVISVNDKIGLKLKYPTSSISEEVKDVSTETDLFFKILKNCIDIIYDEKNEYSIADSTEQEVDEFLQSLDVKAFNNIQKFFTTMPRMHYEVKYTNSLGTERSIVLSSLNDFFTLG